MKSMVVLGGTGFLGRQICAAALRSGWKVTSLSKSGTPPTNGSIPISELSQIRWRKADAFEPSSYTEHLEGADAVVHTMGTIFGNTEYKNVINGGLSPSKLCDLVKMVAPKGYENPMRRGEKGANEQDAFERLNRESAVLLAKEFARVSEFRRPFVYISAADWNPVADRRYIQSKREAEKDIEAIANLRPVIIRPGFMYNEKDTSSVRHFVGMAMKTAGTVGDVSGLKCLSNPALPVDKVAKSVVEAAEDATIEGIIELEALQKYASLI
ncbi:MIOREX complex component 2 [Trichomonascus vanleenenianus]|uniref:ubiquinone biosynthesis protein COQ11 n=1 Tax=Trichomonascus vanleenenianus TaxID=2268995 RepID=UPI003EC98FE8